MQPKSMFSNVLIMVPKLPLWQSVSVGLVMVLSFIFTYVATPTLKQLAKPPPLEKVVLLQIDDWQNRPSSLSQVYVNTFSRILKDAIYDQNLMKAYEDKHGSQVMLAEALATEQRQEIKVHRPEVCYPAKGYKQIAMQPHEFELTSYAKLITGKQLILMNQNVMEAVSYWIKMGDSFPISGFEMRLKIRKEVLKGNLTDGVLVRASNIINQESQGRAAYKVHKKFMTALVTAIHVTAPNLLVPRHEHNKFV